LRVFLHRDVIVSAYPALVRRHDRDRVRQIPYRHGRLLDPAQLEQLACLGMDRRVDVDPYEDALPFEVEIVHGQGLGRHYASPPSSIRIIFLYGGIDRVWFWGRGV